MADGIDLTASASALREALLARTFTASALLEASFTRIDALNPRLNAIVAEDRDAARAMAKVSDARIASGTARPLEGLPITIKDAVDVAGRPSSGGLPAYRERLPQEDAAAVARRRAGDSVLHRGPLPAVPPFGHSLRRAAGSFRAWNALRSEHAGERDKADRRRGMGAARAGRE